MALPTMSPEAVVSPRVTTNKRKHHTMDDLTEDENAAAVALPSQPQFDDDNSESIIEDYADHYELSPFVGGT